MAQSLIACPLCSAASFSSTNALCLSLVNVASKWLRCTLCEEELRGIDKLTIHLLSHLINNTDFKRSLDVNNICTVEPLNLVKTQKEQFQDANDQEMLLEKNNSSIIFKSKRNEEDINGRLSLKIDDEVMIFFNSSDKNRQASSDHSSSQITTKLVGNVADILDKNISTASLPKFCLDFTNNISEKTDEIQTKPFLLSANQQSHTASTNPTSHFMFPNKDFLQNCKVQSDISQMDLTPLSSGSGLSNFEDTFNVNKSNSYSDLENGEKMKSSFLSPNGERILGYRCDICSLVFPDEHILSMHRQLIHVELNGDPANTRTFKCHLCSKSFVMKGSLMVHMRVAHFGGAVVSRLVEAKQLENNAVSPESAQFVCSICNKGFKKEQQLVQHERLHDGKQCDVCLKTFTTKYFLRKHKRLHTGEMPYTCHVCNKSFTFQQSYHKHLLYHSNDKPHTCPECGRAFKELSTLQNHQRIHTGEKPFSCETCGKCFRQRVSYLVHRRIHTGVMPYRCQDCGKTFRYKVSERTHKCQTGAAADPPATVTIQEEMPSSDHQVVSESSLTVEKNWHSKDAQTFPSHLAERNNNYLEPTDFFSLVMSPSDRLQILTLSADCSRQDAIDTESLKELLYDVADYN